MNQDIDIVDQKILDYLKQGKNTREIATLLNAEGLRTIKGDTFMRKTVNNKITLMKVRGIAIPKFHNRGKQKKFKKIEEIKPIKLERKPIPKIQIPVEDDMCVAMIGNKNSIVRILTELNVLRR